MTKIIINKSFIQFQADCLFCRNLTKEEYEEVYETILESLSEFVQDSIYRVTDFNNLLERNKGASKILPHYKVYYRNDNAYQPEFRVMGVFLTEEDSKEYIRHDDITEFDEWKLTLVDENCTEKDIYKIHC